MRDGAEEKDVGQDVHKVCCGYEAVRGASATEHSTFTTATCCHLAAPLQP